MSSINAYSPVTRPTRIGRDSGDEEQLSISLPTSDLTGYRLKRLEAEVLEPARNPASATSKLRHLISAYVRLAITDPGIVPLISRRYRGSAAEPALKVESDSIEGFLVALHKNLLEVMETRGRALLIDPNVAAHSLLGIIHWGIDCHRTENRLGRDEAATQIAALALHGLIPSPAECASLG